MQFLWSHSGPRSLSAQAMLFGAVLSYYRDRQSRSEHPRCLSHRKVSIQKTSPPLGLDVRGSEWAYENRDSEYTSAGG